MSSEWPQVANQAINMHYSHCCIFTVVIASGLVSFVSAGPVSRARTNVTRSGTRLSSPENLDQQRPFMTEYHFAPQVKPCQVRLDFLRFNIAEDTMTLTGDCPTDFMVLNAANTNYYMGNLCGDLTGQHVYLEYGEYDEVIVTIVITSADTKVLWDIDVTFIECGSELAAPKDCLQYFTYKEGTTTSFNFNNKQQLNDQNYTMCIRKSEGTEQIKVTTCGGPDDFIISGQPPILSPDPTKYPDIKDPKSGPSCTTDFVELGGTPYCGNWLGREITWTDTTGLSYYRIPVYTNDNELGSEPGVGEDYRNSGFRLCYSQS